MTMSGNLEPRNREIIPYQTDDGQSWIQLRAVEGAVRLTQRRMAELFAVTTDNIGFHLKSIYKDGERVREATTEESSVVRSDHALLDHTGKISVKSAKMKAESEYTRFRTIEDAKPQAVDAHFEQAVQRLANAKKKESK